MHTDTRPRALTREAQDALLGAACDDARPFMTLALDTGIRMKELLAIRWADVDLAGAALTIRASKGGPRRVALSAETVAAMRTLPPGEPLTPAKEALRAALAAAADRAAEAHPELRGLRWHDLRHAAAIRRLREIREKQDAAGTETRGGV